METFDDSERNLRIISWEGRSYEPFCVMSKQDLGEQIGFLDGDEDDRISTFRDYPASQWLASWMPMDGGVMLYKEESVEDIPDGLENAYG